jgi:hypothetical protein
MKVVYLKMKVVYLKTKVVYGSRNTYYYILRCLCVIWIFFLV